MKTLKKISYALIILLFTISCKKDDLPKATQEGKNVMAAKIDGNVWINTACSSCIGGGSGLSVSYEQMFINILGQQKNGSTSLSIQLYFKVQEVGNYIINGTSFNDDNFIKLIDKNITYNTSKQHTGNLNITKIDRVNKILSGTFSFTAVNENNLNDVKSITDGRFDVTYN